MAKKHLRRRLPGLIGQSLYTNANQALLSRSLTLMQIRTHWAEHLHRRQLGGIKQDLKTNVNQALLGGANYLCPTPNWDQGLQTSHGLG